MARLVASAAMAAVAVIAAVAVLCAPAAARAAVPVLDAPSIAVVRIESAVPDAWGAVQGGERVRTVRMTLVAERVLRGPLCVGSRLDVTAEQHEAVGRHVAVPGAWSGKPLDAGLRYLVFGPSPSEIVRVAAASETVDVELVLACEKNRWPLGELARRAGAQRKALGPIFAEYLTARLPAAVAKDAAGWDAVAKLVEAPDLSPTFRAGAAAAVIDAVLMQSPAPPPIVARTVVMAFRLLALPEAPGFHDRLLRASLPNLLGFEGSEPKHTPAEIFAAHAAARAQAAKALAALPPSDARARLQAWLAD